MIAADTSVVVAAFASWHESHTAARAALAERPRLVAHCAVEAYSVLTRLPTPYRAPTDVVVAFLAARFPDEPIGLDPDGYRDLPTRLAELGIAGGAAYDALVALTAAHAGAALLSCDRRARSVYERCGVEVRAI